MSEGSDGLNALLLTLTGGLTLAPTCLVIWHYPLGFHWSGDVCYSSDYFDQLHQYAIELINKGLAYVDGIRIVGRQYSLRQFKLKNTD